MVKIVSLMYILPQFFVNEGKGESEGEKERREKGIKKGNVNVNRSSLVSNTYFPN